MGVHDDLILGSVTDQTVIVGEGHIRWFCTLVVDYGFYTIILPDTDATRRRKAGQHKGGRWHDE